MEGQSRISNGGECTAQTLLEDANKELLRGKSVGEKPRAQGSCAKPSDGGKSTSALHDTAGGFAFSHAQTSNIKLKKGKIMLNYKVANINFL